MPITMAADHEFAARYLADSTVKVKGFDVQVGWPQGRGQAAAITMYQTAFTEPMFDVIVLPLTNLLIAVDQGLSITGLPVWVDLSFPHVGAQVNRQAGVRTPKDLEGKRVGTLGYGFGPSVLMRGALADVHGVDSRTITWVEYEPNSLSTATYPRPEPLRIEKGTNQMEDLESGHIAAAFFSRVGPRLTERTARLFERPLPEARTYYERTGVFPPNTVLAAKTEVLEANPGLAEAIVEAWEEARELYCRNVRPDDSHMGYPVWWLFDNGFFPYQNGVENNRAALETISRYCHEIGITSRRVPPEDAFFRRTG